MITLKARVLKIFSRLTRVFQMQAMNGRVGEKYIIAIARELAKGLKAVHDADIIHRDIKGIFQQQPAC